MHGGRKLIFHQIPVGEMANYAYLIGDPDTRAAVIIDPAWNLEALLRRAEADDLDLAGALVTHYHPDHVGGQIFGHRIEGLGELLARRPVPVHVHAVEAEGLRRLTGLSETDLVRHEGGDALVLGPNVRIRLLHTPGHTPGSQCFLVEQPGHPPLLVSGDTLFLGGCGRVDLPGGDPEAMYRSLHHVLRRLPDETVVFPGHAYAEPYGTLGEEKRRNPYLRAVDLPGFLRFMGYA